MGDHNVKLLQSTEKHVTLKQLDCLEIHQNI